MEMQKVWRTFSKTNSGFFVWEAMEVIGEVTPGRADNYIVETQDDGHVYVSCSHFFTEQSAMDFLLNNGLPFGMNVEIINSPTPTTCLSVTDGMCHCEHIHD